MEISIERFNEVMAGLEAGTVRVAEKRDGRWQVNREVKEVILAGFRLGAIADMSQGQFPFFDKDTFPVRRFSAADGVRIVPGGSSIRRGAYVAPGAIVMPPSYINAGAYVGEGTMVDSHVTIGSCAQVGRNIHISAATQIGGVLEPAGAMPTIIEDGAFVGGIPLRESSWSATPTAGSWCPPAPWWCREAAPYARVPQPARESASTAP